MFWHCEIRVAFLPMVIYTGYRRWNCDGALGLSGRTSPFTSRHSPLCPSYEFRLCIATWRSPALTAFLR
jgi:hypothetical protein